MSASQSEKETAPLRIDSTGTISPDTIEHEIVRTRVDYSGSAVPSNTHLIFRWYNADTGVLLYTYSYSLTPGWTYFWGMSWIGHRADEEISKAGTYKVDVSCGALFNYTMFFVITDTTPQPVICTPGALECHGTDLYVCNQAGTAWTLKQANSPTCQAGGQIPDFWNDPVGWVIGTITAAWESMLGFVSGQFNVFLANVKNFQENFSEQLAEFINDPIGHVRDWVEDIIPTLGDWWDGIVDGIGEWYDTNIGPAIDTMGEKIDDLRDWVGSGYDSLASWWQDIRVDIGSWIDDAVSGINEWIADFPATIGAWWDDAITGITTWFNEQIDILKRGWDVVVDDLGAWWDDQVEILQNGWDNVVSGMETWFDDQVTILQRGWDATFATIPDIIGDAVNGVKEWVEDFVPEVVGAMFEWAKPIVDPIVNAAGWIGDIAGIITGQKPEEPEIKHARETIKEQREKILELIKEL